jgi:transglutaminase-like putative cysteine protease
MLIDIYHLTRHVYTAPVRESVTEVRKQPRSGVRQRLLAFQLRTEPEARLFSYVDWLGNTIHHFDVPESHDTLSVEVRALVETAPGEQLPPQASQLEWDRVRGERVKLEFHDFLAPSHYVRLSQDLAAFLAEHGIDHPGPDPLVALCRLKDAIYRALAYRPGVTEWDSPSDQALARREGVCQDFAHVMIAAARSWGIPARYVSGYLYHEKNDAERSSPDASHAWAECYLPTFGWIGFDPTNDILAGERHVAAAVGRDYADAPPSRGVFKGGEEGALEVEVRVAKGRPGATPQDIDRSERRRIRAEQTRQQSRDRSAALQQLQQQQQ